MEIRIKETNELKELRIIDGNGVEWTEDLIGNQGDLHRNKETEEYELTETEYKWWKEYIENKEADEKEVSEVAEEFEIDEAEIWDRINGNLCVDLDDEHREIQNVLEEIREEKKYRGIIEDNIEWLIGEYPE